MKTLKKNQIIILVIALMLVSAGYLSYTTNQKNEVKETSSLDVEENLEYAGIGDAKLVSSNAVEINEQVARFINEEKSENTIINSTNKEENQTVALVENKIEETKETSVKNKEITKEIQEYFSSSRLNRENMYSQMIESYQKILENNTINEGQKSIAQAEIKNINDTKNKIMICENLIKTKGFEDLIIFVNDTSVNVIVRADLLEQNQIAQIQNIIQREMNAEISDIHITNK